MRIGYFDCFSGIAGDMILGALVGCGVGIDELREDLAGLALGGYRIEHRRVQRGALAADKVDVVIEDGDQPHRGLADLRAVLEASELPAAVAERADRIFLRMVEAEARAHGKQPEDVHLHDLGAVDAIVDVVGACAGLRRLRLDSLICSPLNVGGGHVASAHGELPVPAPATAYLLSGAPLYSRGPEVELVTPTGAAIVATLCEGFGAWPEMTLEAVGYGAGDHELEGRPNVLRLAVGGAPEAHEGVGRRVAAAGGAQGAGKGNAEGEGSLGHPGPVSVIETNIDDLNPQVMGAVVQRLLEAGALDAYTVPAFMKKNRPGIQLTVVAPSEQVDLLADLIFRETTTLGVRTYPVQRRELRRRHERVETPWGEVRVKVAVMGESTVTISPEFDDCETIARANSVPVDWVIQAAKNAYQGSMEPHSRNSEETS